jgi:hypothetical protein
MRVLLPKTADFGFYEEHFFQCIKRFSLYPPETLVSTFHLLNQGKLLAAGKG